MKGFELHSQICLFRPTFKSENVVSPARCVPASAMAHLKSSSSCLPTARQAFPLADSQLREDNFAFSANDRNGTIEDNSVPAPGHDCPICTPTGAEGEKHPSSRRI